jgi:signal transduction histidine kinase
VLNAVEASGDKGTPIRLSTRYNEERERCEIRVRDKGCGIPHEQLDSIFIPFFTTKPHGTGLGLAVCQRIVTNHGGYIHVESQVGEGSEFIVRIPLRRKKETITGSFNSPTVKTKSSAPSRPSNPPLPVPGKEPSQA